MLRAARSWLFAAKTSVKEPVKAKAGGAKKTKKPGFKVVDKTQWHHSRWNGNRLNDLVEALPRPPQGAKQSDWLHKNGYGLKFYREGWVRFPEPSYWTIVRYKPKLGEGKDAVAWGIRTWRGITETLPRRIPSSHKKEWRILLEPGTQLGPSLGEHWTAPSITLSSATRDSTQLPDDLPGALPAKWPYPWGKLGTHNFPATNPRPLTTEEKALAEEEAAEDEAWAKTYAKERGRIMGGHRAVDAEADAENADAAAAAEGDAAAATEGAAAAEAATEQVVLDVEAKEVAAETEAEKK